MLCLVRSVSPSAPRSPAFDAEEVGVLKYLQRPRKIGQVTRLYGRRLSELSRPRQEGRPCAATDVVHPAGGGRPIHGPALLNGQVLRAG
jgi:hypothetical protein